MNELTILVVGDAYCTVDDKEAFEKSIRIEQLVRILEDTMYQISVNKAVSIMEIFGLSEPSHDEDENLIIGLNNGLKYLDSVFLQRISKEQYQALVDTIGEDIEFDLMAWIDAVLEENNQLK